MSKLNIDQKSIKDLVTFKNEDKKQEIIDGQQWVS